MAQPSMVESIAIYGSDACGHCLRAQSIAGGLLGTPVPITSPGKMPPGSRVQGRDTIPVVVVNGIPVGGADELEAIAETVARSTAELPTGSEEIKPSGKGITGDANSTMNSSAPGTCGQAGGAKSKKSKSSKTVKSSSTSKKSKSPSKRKPSAYAKFVKKFAADHKGQFKGPSLMKNAGAAWGKMTDSEKGKFK